MSFINNIFSSSKKYDLVGAYSASQIAKYILYKCTTDNESISNLQLQKILYYLQVYFLQHKNKALFIDEVEAWPFGPVVRLVYNDYCGFGALDIYETKDPCISFDREDEEIINKIIDEKRSQNPWELVEDTHVKGKAWDIIYQDGAGYKEIIPKELIITNG